MFLCTYFELPVISSDPLPPILTAQPCSDKNVLMDNNKSPQILITLGTTMAICLTILAAAALFSSQAGKFAARDDAITVKGYAERKADSDWTEWTVYVSCKSKNRSELVTLTGKKEKGLRAWLEKEGVREGEIRISPLQILEEFVRDGYGNITNAVDFYTGSLVFTISTENIGLIQRVSREIVALNDAEMAVNSNAPMYLIRDLEQYKLELLREATTTARSRAEEIVKAGGRKLGGLKSASQGVFQVTAPNSVDVSGYGEYDTSTPGKKVSLVVTVEYGVTK